MKSTLAQAPAFTLRDMSESDAQAVSALAARIWQAHYPSIISQAQIDYMLELMYSPSSLKEQLKKGHRFWLLYDGAALAGYVSVEAKGPGHWFIQKLYVDQSVPRRGMGSTLLHHLIAELKPRELSLVVNRKNIKAINFYFKHGFAIDSVVVTEIGNGFIMDDFRMKRTL